MFGAFESMTIMARIIFALAMLAVALVVRCEAADPVVLVENKWTSSALNVKIAELVIEQEIEGTEVDVEVISGNGETFTQLAGQNVDAVLEIWPSGINDLQLGLVRAGSIIELGQLGVIGQIGWFVPDYVIEDYPEAASWEFYTLNSTAELFATPETAPLGRFLGVDPGYSGLDDQIISNLGLPFVQVYAGDEPKTLDILAAAVAAREPVLMYWWTPEAAVGEYNLRKVDLPPITDACRASITNQDGLYACDYPEDRTEKFASSGLEAMNPAVFEFLQNFRMTNEIQIELLQRVVFGNETVEAVASDWVARNSETWRPWLVREGGTSGVDCTVGGGLVAVLVSFASAMWALY